MESTPAPRRSGKWIKGMKKEPTFGDIAIAEASTQIEKDLAEQKERAVREIHHHHDVLMGDEPVVVREAARAAQGVRGEPGPRGAEGAVGAQGPPGAPGAPGAPAAA